VILLYVYIVFLILSFVGLSAFLVYRERLSKWQKWGHVFAAIIIIILLSPIWCSVGRFAVSEVVDRLTHRPLHPTYEDLQRHGFYVFVLPTQEAHARGWQQDITLWSWNIHCGVLSGDTYNPLVVTYRDDADNDMFIIQHGPWGVIWDYSQATNREQILWESKWTSTNSITYHTQPAEYNLGRYLYQFSDMQGWNVAIVSSLSVTETLELIKELEYVGPPIEILDDPWDCKD
jgi:hypothetical protein